MSNADSPVLSAPETLELLRQQSHVAQLSVAFVEENGEILSQWLSGRAVSVSARLRGPAGTIQRVMPLEDVLIESAAGMVVEDLVGPTSEPFVYCAVGDIRLIDVALDGTETSSVLYAWVLDYRGSAKLPLSGAALPWPAGSPRPSTGRALARQLVSLPNNAPQAKRLRPAIRRAEREGVLDQLIATAWAEGLEGAREWAVVEEGPTGEPTVVAASGRPAIQRPGIDLAGVLAGRAHEAIYEEIVGGQRHIVRGLDGEPVLGKTGEPLRQWYSASTSSDPAMRSDARAEAPGRRGGDRLRDREKGSPVGGATGGLARLGGHDELEQVLRERGVKPLSREAKVAELLSEGLNSRQVAERLRLKIGTVKSVKNRIKQKLKRL